MQSKQWQHSGSLPPKKLKSVHLAGKVIALIFWDSHGVIIIDYLEQGRTINGTYCAGGLRRKSQERGEKN